MERNLEPMDNRVKHTNRGNVLDPLVLNKISDHIASFPTKVSHYTAHPITYLPADLTVKKMNDLFELKYLDLNIVVKYEFYLNYFKENFGYQ